MTFTSQLISRLSHFLMKCIGFLAKIKAFVLNQKGGGGGGGHSVFLVKTAKWPKVTYVD